MKSKLLALLSICLFTGSLNLAHSQTINQPEPGTPEYQTAKANGQLNATLIQKIAVDPAAKDNLNPGLFQANDSVEDGCYTTYDSTWTSLSANDDGSTSEIPIPFTFNMYGTEYNSIYINNNGNITFNSAVSSYTADGFPISTPMVAPFWADVDTRGDSSDVVWYKVTSTAVYVNYPGVGYYSSQDDKLNTFQVIITDGNDPAIGVGNNVAFYYGDMQWTTGSASGGSNGFGGTPSTVGINNGDGINFFQIGRFDQEGDSLAGPYDLHSGVSWLDGKCFTFNVNSSGSNNIPPIVQNISSNSITICEGDSAEISWTFTGPEANQLVSVELQDSSGTGSAITSSESTDETTSGVLTVTADAEGVYQFQLVATDDGDPAESTTVTIELIVNNCDEPFDCPDLQANIGDSCDDENDDTENDVVTQDCNCEGTPVEVFDCPDLQANIGDDCDDENDETENDMITADCNCEGTPIQEFDCPDLQANIGDSCDDENDDTENDVVTQDCNCEGTPVEVFDCPDLQANIGDSCDDENPDTGNDMVTENCGCEGTPVIEPDCNDFVYYLADHAAADGISDIYEVTLTGGNAELEYIATSDIEVHIAYNPLNNLIYAVSKHQNSYRTLDPVNGVFGSTQSLGADYGEITTAVFNADGKLLIGSQDNNAIYTVNVSTNAVSSYDTYSPLYGGDLAFASDGMLYLATRIGSGLYENWPAGVMPDQLIGDVPDNVTGMAITDTDQLIVSSRDHTSLEIRNTDGSDPGISYPVMLDGEVYTLRDGDMASGCEAENILTLACEDFTTFYVNHGDGIDGSNLYTVEFTVGGLANMAYVTNVDFEAHISFNAIDNIMYFVNANGSSLFVYDIANDAPLGNLPFTGPAAAELTKVTAVIYNPDDGLLYIGDDNNSTVYTVDLTTGEVTFYANAPVSGGDLAILEDGSIYLATRTGNDLYEVIEGGSAVLIGSIPETVTGMARWNDASTSLVLSNNGSTDFTRISQSDASVIDTYTATLDGSIFSLSNGDMAAGCANQQPSSQNGSCNAIEVVEYVEGVKDNGGAINLAQTDPSNALGQPERASSGYSYTTLGYGGSITLAFDGAVPNGPGEDIEVVETTYGYPPSCDAYPEYADVYVSVDGSNWFFATSVCKYDGFVDISDAGDFEYINYVRIVNNDEMSTTPDAYDVDGVVALHNCEEEDDGGVAEAGGAASTLTSYPNPTSGSSEVVFSAAETGRTVVEVYDMNGRKVATLFNTVADANREYTLDFDGSSLPNGVYIYRMTTDHESIIEKFMIAK